MSEIGREHGDAECINNSAIESMRDMLGDILATSSVDSLLRYRLISKLWHGLIRSQVFINLHLKYSNENMMYILCRRAENSNGTEVCLMDNYGKVMTTFPFPEFLQGVLLRVVSSFNGLLILVCVTVKNEFLVLTCNPTTHKVHLIPSGSSSSVFPTVGVAYNCETHQYKVFKFFKDLLEPEKECYACEVYTPTAGSWRRIESVSPSLLDPLARAQLWVAEDLEQSTWLRKSSFEICVERIYSFKSVVACKSEILFIIADAEQVLHYHIYSAAESRWRLRCLSENGYHYLHWAWPVAFPFAESLCHCGAVNVACA